MPPNEIKTSNNAEIDQALKEFESGSGGEKNTKAPEAPRTPGVSSREETPNIKFETDSYKAVKFYDETNAPKMVQLVMKLSGGAIKEQRVAEYILLGLVVIMFALSFYFFFGGREKTSPAPIISDFDQSQFAQ